MQRHLGPATDFEDFVGRAVAFFAGQGLRCEAVARAPYLCQGDADWVSTRVHMYVPFVVLARRVCVWSRVCGRVCVWVCSGSVWVVTDGTSEPGGLVWPPPSYHIIIYLRWQMQQH